MRAVAAVLTFLTGVALFALGFVFAANNALCEDDCRQNPDWLIWTFLCGGLALAIVGIGLGVRTAWRRIRARGRDA